jgi:hypothetical protein
MASFITLHAALLKTMLAISMLMPSTKQKCSNVQERIKIAQQSNENVPTKDGYKEQLSHSLH